MIGRQVRSSSVICRMIVFAVVLFTSAMAMAEDKSMVTGGGESQLVSDRSAESGVPDASDVTIGQATGAENVRSSARLPGQESGVQNQIEREARRLRLGVRGGVALDPDLIVMGVQAQLGPIFKSNVSFRPSVEFAYGEVTAMFGFNGEFIYRLSRFSLQDRWSSYFGGGLGINLLHQNFERDSGGKRIDFGDFHSDSALNIVGGVQNRNGVFMELRTSVYSDPSPTLRLSVGYNF